MSRLVKVCPDRSSWSKRLTPLFEQAIFILKEDAFGRRDGGRCASEFAGKPADGYIRRNSLRLRHISAPRPAPGAYAGA